MSKQFRTQMDLFVTPARPVDLSGAERQKAVELLRARLTEATTKRTGQQSTNGKKEAGNE